MKKVAGLMLVVAMLFGVFGGSGAALAAEEQIPGAGNALVETAPVDSDPGKWRQEARDWKQQVDGKFTKLKALHKETKQLLTELRDKRETFRSLLQEARQNGEKEKLTRLEPLRVDAKALVAATKKLRAGKRELRHELRQAIRQGQFNRAEGILDQIIWHQQVINTNLKQLITITEKTIAILQ